jgi:competence protein ComGC
MRIMARGSGFDIIEMVGAAIVIIIMLLVFLLVILPAILSIKT